MSSLHVGSSEKSQVLYMWSSDVFKNLFFFYHYFSPLDFAWAAIRKYHRWGGLYNRNLFIIILETGESSIKVAADTVPAEVPLPGLQMAVSSHRGERKIQCLFLFL